MESERYHLVAKSNNLIQTSRFNFSVNAQRCLLYCISKIQPNDKDFETYEFEIADMIATAGMNSGGKTYADLKNALKECRDKSIWLPKETGKGETLISFLSEIDTDYRKGVVNIKFHSAMKPFLLELKENYTTYELAYILPMTSKYSIRMYELLKSYSWKAEKSLTRNMKQTFKIEYLRNHFKVEDKYSRFTDFIKRVIDVAINEINEYTDLQVSYETIKTKRRYTHMNFYIERITNDEMMIRNNQIKIALDGEP